LFRHGTTYFEGYKKAGLFQHFSGRKRGSIDDVAPGPHSTLQSGVNIMI
jgi:hypothetical protein